MDQLWLLEGDLEAPGWRDLQRDSKEEKIAVIAFDRERWALVEAEKGPTEYEGLVPARPETGLYVSEQGYPVYVVEGREVRTPEEVVQALGEEAQKKLEEIGDPVVVLQKLGRAF